MVGFDCLPVLKLQLDEESRSGIGWRVQMAGNGPKLRVAPLSFQLQLSETLTRQSQKLVSFGTIAENAPADGRAKMNSSQGRSRSYHR